MNNNEFLDYQGLQLFRDEMQAQAITVDEGLSLESTNPVQNKVITTELYKYDNNLREELAGKFDASNVKQELKFNETTGMNEVASMNAVTVGLESKVNTTTYDEDMSKIDAALESKVNKTTYESFTADIQNQVDTKVPSDLFDATAQEFDAALTDKFDKVNVKQEIAFDEINGTAQVASMNALVEGLESKVNTSTYDQDMMKLESIVDKTASLSSGLEDNIVLNDIENNLAGCKGYYWGKVDVNAKQLVIYSINNTERYVPTVGAIVPEDIINGFNSGYAIGDRLAINNVTHYGVNPVITHIADNIITVDQLPFTDVYATTTENWEAAKNYYSIVSLEHPEAGYDLGHEAQTAMGSGTKALGSGTVASGVNTIAYGSFGHAEGRNTMAGYAAHSEGRDTTASGVYAHAEGQQSTATGIAAHAEGFQARAAGDYAHAEGIKTKTHGYAGHAEGYGSEVGGSYTSNMLTAGTDSSSGAYAHAEGNATLATGIAAHTEGEKTLARGKGSHAEGIQTQTTATAAHAEGQETTASGAYSHTEGYLTQATKTAAHAEGLGRRDADGNIVGGATGAYSHSQNHWTTAQGTGSTSMGFLSTANADYSLAAGRSTTQAGHTYSSCFGEGVVSRGANTVAVGQYNNRNNRDGEHLDLFVVGNGMADNERSDAFAINDAGNVWVAGKVTALDRPTAGDDLTPKWYVDDAIASKVPELTFDSAPMPMSQNAVTSEGIFNFLYNNYLGRKIIINTDAAPKLITNAYTEELTGDGSPDAPFCEFRCIGNLTTAPTMNFSVPSQGGKFATSVVYKAPNSTPPQINTLGSSFALRYDGDDIVGGVFKPIQDILYRMDFEFDGFYINCHVTAIRDWVSVTIRNAGMQFDIQTYLLPRGMTFYRLANSDYVPILETLGEAGTEEIAEFSCVSRNAAVIYQEMYTCYTDESKTTQVKGTARITDGMILYI